MQTIHLDISNKGVYPCIFAKQSEVGRKFLAVITDNGVPYNIPGNSLLSVWYEGDTDAGNYSSIDAKSAFSIDGNKVIVELVAQMLLKPGKGDLCLSITHGDGGETNTWNIPYCVEYKPGAGSFVPTEYYTALTEAGAIAANYAGQAQASAEQSQGHADQAREFANQAQASADNAQEVISSFFPFLGYYGDAGVDLDNGGNGIYLSRSNNPIIINSLQFYNGIILSFQTMQNASNAQIAMDVESKRIAVRTRWFSNAWSNWILLNVTQ